VRTLPELIGHPEFLKQREIPGHPKANKLDLQRLLKDVVPKDDPSPRYCTRERNDPPISEYPVDDHILQDAKDAIVDGTKMSLNYDVRNINRSIGTKVSGEIGYLHGAAGLQPGTLTLNLTGSAGQSFGAFLSPGLRLILSGEANDYVGKGMSGGEIVVRPAPQHKFAACENAIVGNTCLYGASGGVLYANGRAGERFAVRNSGATAVVEGLGDHGCEYMTGGKIVVLGPTGKNFGAGMTGGLAYVLDRENTFLDLYNPGLIGCERLTEEDRAELQKLVFAHLEATDSALAREMLADWTRFDGAFWKVCPHPPASKPKAPAASPSTSVIDETIAKV
jgi:glutamate synthase (NADPH/NADH) large chain/glutamate synthase (ferredoxin)